MTNNNKMVYRRLGRSGLQVSVLSFGSWVSFDTQMKDDLAMECMQAAFDAGLQLLRQRRGVCRWRERGHHGRAIHELGWRRNTYVLSSKFFWGIDDAPNMK